MPTWAAKQDSYTPEPGSSNAYDSYALIAREVEDSVSPKSLDRVYFDPPMEQTLIEKLQKPISELVAASKKKCEFRYSPTPMFTPPAYQRAWRMLGRVLEWKIQQDCVMGSYDDAISLAVTAAKFGFDLTGGAATDASLGFEIVDETRRAIATSIPKLGAQQLATLADGLTQALRDKPSLKTTIEHEHQRMLQGVQYVQDCYASDHFDDLMKSMKEGVRDGVAYLRGLKSQDAKKRPEYFEGFAQEADEEARWLESVADLPEVRRDSAPGPRLQKERPWKSFAMQFFTAAVPLLKIQDETIARTKLAILTCELVKQVKTTQKAPSSLKGFPADLTEDPYTGKQLAYRASGPIFEVYSLGADGIDNAGETDEDFAAPDLKLELR